MNQLIIIIRILIIIIIINNIRIILLLQQHPPIVPINTATISCNDNDGSTTKITVAIGIIYDNLWQYTNKHLIIIYKNKLKLYDPYNHRLYLYNGQIISMNNSYKDFYQKSDETLKNVWNEMSLSSSSFNNNNNNDYTKRFISLGLYMDKQSEFLLNFMISSDGKDFRHIQFHGSLGIIKIDRKHYQMHISSIIMISGGNSDHFVMLVLIKSTQQQQQGQQYTPSMVQIHWNNINDLTKPFGYLCFSLNQRNAFRLQEQLRLCNTTIFLLQSIQYGFVIDQTIYLIATKFNENFVIYMDKNVLEKRNYETKFWIKKLSEFFYCHSPSTTNFVKESHSIPREPWPININNRKNIRSTTLPPFKRGQKPTKIDKIDETKQQQDSNPQSQQPQDFNDDDESSGFFRRITLILFSLKNIFMLIILFAVLFVIRKREKKEGITTINRMKGKDNRASKFLSSTSRSSITTRSKLSSSIASSSSSSRLSSGMRSSSFGKKKKFSSALSSSSSSSSSLSSSSSFSSKRPKSSVMKKFKGGKKRMSSALSSSLSSSSASALSSISSTSKTKFMKKKQRK